MVTIGEIARHAQVSKTTVSRVLNGRPDVDPHTAERIRAVVAALGYVPSANARALAHGRGRSIGLLVPTLELPWLQEVLRGIADEVEAADHTLALHTLARGRESVAAFSAQVAARAIDGLVAVIPHGYEDDLLVLARQGLPIVLIDDASHHDVFPSVWSTDRAGGRQATAHLLA
ncbi:MAG: LacI family DNA-binding transcriptional regulator, partial [Thermomicrobiales bacterium]|nr:LacI family DNA-binding transcriptional regulator [Thermomicrobiales bacterium]